MGEAQQQAPMFDREVTSFHQRDFGCGDGGMNLQRLATKPGVCAGPRLKTAEAVPGYGGSAGKIDEPVFLGKNGGERGFRVILRLWREGAVQQSSQGADDQLGSGFCQSRAQRERGVVTTNRFFFLQQNVAGIEAGVNLHSRYASNGFAARDGPLDRRRPAIFRQQRGVQIEIAVTRQVDHPLRNDASVAHHDDCVGRDALQLGAKLFVILDLVGLEYRETEFHRSALDRRCGQLKSAPAGPVGLGDNQPHAEVCRSPAFPAWGPQKPACRRRPGPS